MLRAMTQDQTTSPVAGELVELEAPGIDVGLGTIAGLLAAAGAVVPVIVSALADDRLNEGTKRTLLIIAGILVGLVVIVRGAQAVARELRAGAATAPTAVVNLNPGPPVGGLGDVPGIGSAER